jgi:hypothetical protein
MRPCGCGMPSERTPNAQRNATTANEKLFQRWEEEDMKMAVPRCTRQRWKSSHWPTGNSVSRQLLGQLLALSASERVGATQIRRMLKSFKGEYRCASSREESDLHRTTGNICRHPLRILAAAERVVMQEALCGRHSEVVEGASAAGVHIRIKGRGNFGGSEGTRLNDGKCYEVDGHLCVGEGNVAGDGRSGIACGAPVAFILGGTGERAEQHKARDGGEKGECLHPSRMALGVGYGQTGALLAEFLVLPSRAFKKVGQF